MRTPPSFLGPDKVRGGCWLTTVQAPPVGLTVTLSSALPFLPPVSPAPGAIVRPDNGLWGAIRTLVLQYFDSLGPGDAPTEEIGSQRFPRPNQIGPDRFFASKVIDKVQEVAGVLGVAGIAISTSGTSPVGALLVPGLITLQPPP